MQKKWVIEEKIPIHNDQALSDYHPILRQLLFNRGHSSAESAQTYLHAEQPADSNPFSILGMEKAVDRIQFAIQNQEKIAIYGDYDVDGVTATALLLQFLEGMGAYVQGYIPNRFAEGYGLHINALDALNDQGIDLVITVDCGIRSFEEANFAKNVGLDLIITDHHTPGDELPYASAVINPRQALDSYPHKNLAGVGLAYKLAEGLTASLDKEPENIPFHLQASSYLDLVALGTVADLAPLTGENRYLVKQGLEYLRRPIHQGVQSLVGVSGLAGKLVKSWDIGFVLGPRINAAGRLDSAHTALKLLISKDVQEAGNLAQVLEQQNTLRQEITKNTQARVLDIIQAQETENLLLFAADADFNPGIVGLVASRLTEQYYRPSIVAHIGPEFTRGSCRSIPEFHITKALDQCKDLLDHHGGHAAAAGFTVRNENLDELMERLLDITGKKLGSQDLQPSLSADMEITLSDLEPKILEYLEWLQPTGQENPNAVFVSRGLTVKQARTVGKDRSHLKLTVTDGRIYYDAIAFRFGYLVEEMPPYIDLVYEYEKNVFNGRTTLQLNVRDIKPSV